jgi:hypothetical protein
MDIIDQANDLIDQEMAARLSSRKYNTLAPTGECYNCGELVDIPRTFCDADCRDDWDRRRRVEKNRP